MVLIAVRWVLPVALVVAGAVLLISGGDNNAGAAVVLIGSAAIVVALNLLLRGAFASNVDREREELAREYYDRHGRWPDE